jgi:uncharacterized protein YjbI with pentapeptide repeats
MSMTALVRTALDRANLAGADLTRSRLTGATLRDANLMDAEFASTFATDANFTGAKIDGDIDGLLACNTTMPDGRTENPTC